MSPEHDLHPRVVSEVEEALRQAELNEQKSNPVEPFMREILIPATLDIMHGTPAVLRAIVTSGRFIGGVVGTEVGYLMGEPGVGFVVGVVLGELVLKPATLDKARKLAKMTFRFIGS